MSESRVVARWSEYPYTSYKRRRQEIEHRVVIEHYGGVGADVRHEVRSSDGDNIPDDWAESDAYELRDHGLREVNGRVEVLRDE